MQISAVVSNSTAGHRVAVSTDSNEKPLAIAAKPSGRGSSVNGGELLMAALATCFCNDLFREAERLGIQLDSVEVEATAEFPGIGLAATNIRYSAKIDSPATDREIAHLLEHTDAVAEVQNTLRLGPTVTLSHSESPVTVDSAP